MAYWGDTTPAAPHRVHKMTLDTSPELKECARRPPPPRHPTFPAGNPLKTEINILKSSLLPTGKIIYTN